jgi:hypothetical protein
MAREQQTKTASEWLRKMGVDLSPGRPRKRRGVALGMWQVDAAAILRAFPPGRRITSAEFSAALATVPPRAEPPARRPKVK